MHLVDGEWVRTDAEQIIDKLDDIANGMGSIDELSKSVDELRAPDYKRSRVEISRLNSAEARGDIEPPVYRPGWEPARRYGVKPFTTPHLVAERVIILGAKQWGHLGPDA